MGAQNGDGARGGKDSRGDRRRRRRRTKDDGKERRKFWRKWEISRQQKMRDIYGPVERRVLRDARVGADPHGGGIRVRAARDGEKRDDGREDATIRARRREVLVRRVLGKRQRVRGEVRGWCVVFGVFVVVRRADGNVDAARTAGRGEEADIVVGLERSAYREEEYNDNNDDDDNNRK